MRAVPLKYHNVKVLLVDLFLHGSENENLATNMSTACLFFLDLGGGGGGVEGEGC